MMAESDMLGVVLDEIRKIREHMVTKEEMESALETIEIVSDPDTLRQLAVSEQDIREGRVRRIRSVKDLV